MKRTTSEKIASILDSINTVYLVMLFDMFLVYDYTTKRVIAMKPGETIESTHIATRTIFNASGPNDALRFLQGTVDMLSQIYANRKDMPSHIKEIIIGELIRTEDESAELKRYLNTFPNFRLFDSAEKAEVLQALKNQVAGLRTLYGSANNDNLSTENAETINKVGKERISALNHLIKRIENF